MATSIIHHLYLDSPLGTLRLESYEGRLIGIYFKDQEDTAMSTNTSVMHSVLDDASAQLKEYFSGERNAFSLPLKFDGTPFEKTVWNELKKIPYGVTVTYKDIAINLGDPNKVRAVGRANGRNPLPVVIPCHRVIGSNQKLVGYAGGIERKRQLLQLEGALLI